MRLAGYKYVTSSYWVTVRFVPDTARDALCLLAVMIATITLTSVTQRRL